MITYLVLGSCILLLFCFFKTKDANVKVALLLGSLVLFSGGFSFIDHPKISPMHVTLYPFLLYVYFANRNLFYKERSSYPLTVATVFLYVTFLISGALGEEGGIYGMYTASRYFIDSYGFLIAAFIIGYRCDYQKISKFLYWPVMIFCGLEFLEAILEYNFVYSWLMEAFPDYWGILEKGKPEFNFFDSWRIRTSVTTMHPTTLGALLLTMFIFYFPQVNRKSHKSIAMLLVLLVALYLSGSRSSWVCCCIYLIYHYVKMSSAVVKGIIIIALASGVYYVGNAFVESFSEEGRGSSLDMRQRNLLVCLFSFAESPIYGHGFNYIDNIIEKNDDGRAIDGSMESVFFNLMVEQGLIGLIAYLFFAGLCYFHFRKLRKYDENVAEIGEGVTICIVIFSLMSGTLGNLHSMAYIVQGMCLGILNGKLSEEKEDELLEIEN